MFNKRFYILPLIVVLLLVSCRDDTNIVAPQTEFTYENVPFNQKGKLMETFGMGISKAMQYPRFRQLIKTEAIKRFNKDTDVLYAMIRDVPINFPPYSRTGEGAESQTAVSTLHDFLLPFFGSEGVLADAENALPLLTIFVPTLPEDSFSAELWDVHDDEQIPDVALALKNISYVPVIGREDEKYLIEPGWFPGYPIVVLKENERVITDQSPRFDELDTRIILGKGSNSGAVRMDFGETDIRGDLEIVEYSYRFRDNNFDPAPSARTGASNGIQSLFQGIDPENLPEYLINAHKAVNPPGSSEPIGWQRDNIYYGITPENPEGSFIGCRYRECVATFRLVGSVNEVFSEVSDSFIGDNKSDPELRPGWLHNKVAFTDGAYDFAASVKVGYKDSEEGTISTSFIGIKAEELFEITWKSRRKWKWPRMRTEWSPTITETKTVNTATRDRAWMFGDWGIDSQATQWYISFEEVDTDEIGTYEEFQGSKSAIETTVGADRLLNDFQVFFGNNVVDKTCQPLVFDVDSWTYTYAGPFNCSYSLTKINPEGKVEFSFVPVQVQDF
jgi:hypothetical protein